MTARLASGERVRESGAFAERIARAAGGFAALGIGQGDCVALLMRNDFAFLEASLAAIRLGAYAVPINWHFKAEEVAYILADCGAKVLVAHADLLAGVAGSIPAGVEVLVVPVAEEICASYGLSPAFGQVPAGATAWDTWLAAQTPWRGAPLPQTSSMIYTSGTTGRPKGVRRNPLTPDLEARMADYRERVYGLAPGVRTMIPGPLYHSAPNAFALRAARVASLIALMPRFDPETFLALVEKHRIEAMFMVPTMFVRLLKLPAEVRRRYDLSSLKFVMHAAAPCAPDVKRGMIEWLGPVIHEFYGSTESGAVTVVDSAEWLARPGTVGRPIQGASIRIYDDAGRRLGANQVGEIYTRLEFLPEFTYHQLPDKRTEIDREGFITSGDVGYLDDAGYLFLCDRKRDMVISGGVNIYPAEIEAVLITCPGVKDCAVFGIPDGEFGEALMAVIEPHPGATPPDTGEVRAYLARHLADYKVPKRIELGRDLPREDSGKIFKRRLRDPDWANAGRAI
ncbi:MAG TPA: acyl-CoA synthetase [Hyphomicrobiaceae bacterium]|nr:acyl-CoA synthetase [Hyphomicrobiaceae bacterium]